MLSTLYFGNAIAANILDNAKVSDFVIKSMTICIVINQSVETYWFVDKSMYTYIDNLIQCWKKEGLQKAQDFRNLIWSNIWALSINVCDKILSFLFLLFTVLGICPILVGTWNHSLTPPLVFHGFFKPFTYRKNLQHKYFS